MHFLVEFIQRTKESVTTVNKQPQTSGALLISVPNVGGKDIKRHCLNWPKVNTEVILSFCIEILLSSSCLCKLFAVGNPIPKNHTHQSNNAAALALQRYARG